MFIPAAVFVAMGIILACQIITGDI